MLACVTVPLRGTTVVGAEATCMCEQAIENLLHGGASSAELRRMGQNIAEKRAAIEGERRRWEVAVVRLARPKTCAQLLGLATGAYRHSCIRAYSNCRASSHDFAIEQVVCRGSTRYFRHLIRQEHPCKRTTAESKCTVT